MPTSLAAPSFVIFPLFSTVRGRDHDTVSVESRPGYCGWLFQGRVFATMLRMSESGKHSRAAKRRRGLAQWHRVVLAALVAGTVGGSAYAFFPGTATAPVADRLHSGTSRAQTVDGVLGAGQISSSYAAPPAPIVTATAQTPRRHRKPRPVPTPKPSAPAGSPAATPSAPPADAGGIGLL